MKSKKENEKGNTMILKVIKSGRPIKSKPLINSKMIYEAMRFLEKEDREHFYVLHLDAKNRIITKELISVGSLSSSIVHPREVFKGAIISNTLTIICVHNHPSGGLDPSKEDISITDRLKKAGQIIGIPVLDHVIIGEGGYISILEHSYSKKQNNSKVAEKPARKRKGAVRKSNNNKQDKEIKEIVNILKNDLPNLISLVLNLLRSRMAFDEAAKEILSM